MELAQATYGPKFRLMVQISYYFQCWGVCVVYTVAINNFFGTAFQLLDKDGDTIPNFLKDRNGKFWPLLSNFLIVLPLSIPRNLHSLRYVGSISYAIAIFLSLFIIFEAFSISDLVENFDLVE